MKYSTEENAIIIFHELLHSICSMDLADRPTIDALTRRVKTAGMSRALTEMILDVIDYVHEKGTDE